MTNGKAERQGPSMIERVARAICGWTPNVTSWADACEPRKDADKLQAIYHAEARAAIEAMREPTDAMDEAGQTVANAAYLEVEELPADAHFVWQAMIEAALHEQAS